MEIIINLTHDTLLYNIEKTYGTLKEGMLFGVEDFSIYKHGRGYYVDFVVEQSNSEVIRTYPCKFTDHYRRLVVTIN